MYIIYSSNMLEDFQNENGMYQSLYITYSNIDARLLASSLLRLRCGSVVSACIAWGSPRFNLCHCNKQLNKCKNKIYSCSMEGNKHSCLLRKREGIALASAGQPVEITPVYKHYTGLESPPLPTCPPSKQHSNFTHTFINLFSMKMIQRYLQCLVHKNYLHQDKWFYFFPSGHLLPGYDIIYSYFLKGAVNNQFPVSLGVVHAG